VSRRLVLLAALLALLAVPASAAAKAGSEPPWRAAADVRKGLAKAEEALIITGPAEARRWVERAQGSYDDGLAAEYRESAPAVARRLEDALAGAAAAASSGNLAGFEAARGTVTAGLVAGSYTIVLDRIASGDSRGAAQWLLVREFRAPTRFSRPGADATLALRALERGKTTAADAAAAVRADLLDTYQDRLRVALQRADDAESAGFQAKLAGAAARASGYFAILSGPYEAQRGGSALGSANEAFEALAAAALAGDSAAYEAARARVESALDGFRAAPLSADEQSRRAGQFQRFLALVPVEYARGVSDGKVTKDFEIQEAVNFRDGVASAFNDLESILSKTHSAESAEIGTLVESLGADLTAASRGTSVADPDAVEDKAQRALDLSDQIFPDAWKESGASADFDVIGATLDRMQAAVAAGQYGQAEAARLEAYAFFEFGPEQRLRGLASDLFVRTEGLFWYGADDHSGLAQLIKHRADPQQVAATRDALDTALADAQQAVGDGPKSTFAVVSNTAIIVFREGLEAVLILAALMAGMVGVQRGLRKPLLVGALAAGAATVVTWVVAQTVLGSLNRYGEKLEAIVSLVAIGVLLLILNWFYHRVYWSDRLASFHGKKKRLVKAGLIGAGTAQFIGLAALGFSSVYREGFETTLFLQALVLEAGAPRVLLGVAIGVAGAMLVGVLTMLLQRKLPHKKMLVATGALILWVLIVMVGTTVQILQSVGWLPVTPIDGLRLPYWAGLWFGIFPTWEGIGAQLGAAAIVLGSYFAAEGIRKRRRRRIMSAPVTAPRVSAEEPARVESPV